MHALASYGPSLAIPAWVWPRVFVTAWLLVVFAVAGGAFEYFERRGRPAWGSRAPLLVRGTAVASMGLGVATLISFVVGAGAWLAGDLSSPVRLASAFLLILMALTTARVAQRNVPLTQALLRADPNLPMTVRASTSSIVMHVCCTCGLAILLEGLRPSRPLVWSLLGFTTVLGLGHAFALRRSASRIRRGISGTIA